MLFGALFGGHGVLGDHQGGARGVPQHLCPLTWGGLLHIRKSPREAPRIIGKAVVQNG